MTQAAMTQPPRAAGRADGKHLLAGITSLIERVLGSVAEVGTALTAVAAVAGRPLRRADLAALRPLVAEVLARHRGFAAGAGVVLAPGVLADAQHWIDWWWADQGDGLGQLKVDLDPESAEFYDYTTTQWYREPARTGRPCVAGPYVDYICTRKYTFTLSVPVTGPVPGGFLGVAGADILASEVEQMLLPGLARLGRAALISGNGRVIASSAPGLLPGVVLRPGEMGPMSTGQSTAAGSLPWMLVTEPGSRGKPGSVPGREPG